MYCIYPCIRFLNYKYPLETRVQSQVESYQKLKRLYLMPPCLTLCIIRYISRVRWRNPGKGVALSPTTRSLRVTLDYSQLTYIYIYIYIYICVCVYVLADWDWTPVSQTLDEHSTHYAKWNQRLLLVLISFDLQLHKIINLCRSLNSYLLPKR